MIEVPASTPWPIVLAFVLALLSMSCRARRDWMTAVLITSAWTRSNESCCDGLLRLSYGRPHQSAAGCRRDRSQFLT